MNLFDLVRTYKIPEDVVKEACNKIDTEENLAWERHTYVASMPGGLDEEENNGEIEPFVCSLSANKLSFDLCAFALEAYYDEFAYAQAPQFSSIRLNRYKEGCEMLPHVDSISTFFSGSRRGVPLCSVVGLLRGAKEGGEFFIRAPDQTYREFLTEDQTVIVFPSSFMYEHYVLPVKKGIRDSYVSWTYY